MQENQVYKKIILFFFTIAIYFCFAPALSAMAQDKPVLSLSDAIIIAVENHSKIKEAVEKLNSAAFESRSARADMFPKASANYFYTNLGKKPFQWMDMGPAGKKATPVAHSDQYHWDVTLVQPLFTGFALTTRYDMTKLEVEVKKQEKKIYLPPMNFNPNITTKLSVKLQQEDHMKLAEALMLRADHQKKLVNSKTGY